MGRPGSGHEGERNLMEYVDLDARTGDLSGVLDPTSYLDHLPSIAGELPPGARAFATDPAHYDFRGLRCVKDLELRHLRVTGTDGDALEARFLHNCWKHDADLVIRYTGVARWTTTTPAAEDLSTLILDEVLPHPRGCRHEAAFRDGTLTVVCRDLDAVWTEALCRTGGGGPCRG
ncbi:hypothetical protein ACFZC6_19070 [Streptomyces ossamyceticus]|uniref:hypothetical protein n=1 Tax=Streptomyces ossamyceticus TaxID=249581 RepID=UPI0036ED9F41